VSRARRGRVPAASPPCMVALSLVQAAPAAVPHYRRLTGVVD